MITSETYSNGTRLSHLNINNLNISLSVIGAGLKADNIAYIMAKVSRFREPVSNLLTEICNSSDDTNKKAVSEIIEGYGHASVRALGHINGCIEGLSIYHTLQAFNLCSLVDGQERSTRYVNINSTHQKDDWFYIPFELHYIPELKESYTNVMNNWMYEFRRTLNLYKEGIRNKYEKDKPLSKKVVNARALDCARYFLPMGTRTTAVFNQAGREWVDLISMWKSSSLKGDNILGSKLEHLLINTEGGELIKHTKDNANRLNNIALDYIKDCNFVEEVIPNFMQVYSTSLPIEWGYNTILNPYCDNLINNKYDLVNQLISLINNHESLDKRVSRITSGFVCRGITDLGTLKDLNRHRNMVYIPFLMERYTTNIKSQVYYEIPSYIEEGRLNYLEADFEESIDKGLCMVEDWFDKAKGYLGEIVASEIIKYLLPHAYCSPYFVSGDVNRWHYLLNLRSKWEGHISYRNWAYKCNELWREKGYNFVPNINKPDANSIEELEYRS